MYRSKQHAQANPAEGERFNEPSMTIEGEYMEMKDILRHALQGSEIPKSDVQYFRPDEIQQINSLYKASLDLTDIDALQQKTSYMQNALQEAQARKEAELLEKQKLDEETKTTETKTSE